MIILHFEFKQGQEEEAEQCRKCKSEYTNRAATKSNPFPHQSAGGDQRNDALHAVQSIPWLQGGAPGAQPARHRLCRVHHRAAEQRSQRGAPGLQNNSHACDENYVCQKVDAHRFPQYIHKYMYIYIHKCRKVGVFFF